MVDQPTPPPLNRDDDEPKKTPELGEAARDFFAALRAKARDLASKTTDVTKDWQAKLQEGTIAGQGGTEEPDTTSQSSTKTPTSKSGPPSATGEPSSNTNHLHPNKKVLFAGIGCLSLFSMCCVCGMIGTIFDIGEGNEVAAKVRAEMFVTDQLKAPRTARFPSTTSYVARSFDDTWMVSGYVDAQNSYGAMIRSEWFVTLRYEGRDKWKLVSIEFTEPGLRQ